MEVRKGIPWAHLERRILELEVVLEMVLVVLKVFLDLLQAHL